MQYKMKHIDKVSMSYMRPSRWPMRSVGTTLMTLTVPGLNTTTNSAEITVIYVTTDCRLVLISFVQ